MDWDKIGLTYSRTLLVNQTGYYPGFSTNNTISTTPNSHVHGNIYDYALVGSSQSVSRLMLFDTYTPSAPTYNTNPLQSDQGRIPISQVMTNGSAAFNSNSSLLTTYTDELQYIFNRVIYPQTNFKLFYPTSNWSASK